MTHTQIPLLKSYWRGYPVTVTRVVDADTLDVIIDLGLGVQKKERLRILDIDAPEVRGPEKEEGLRASAFVSAWVAAAGQLWISTKGEGKYGRLLAHVYNEDGYELSEVLLNEGLVLPYRKS